MKEPREWDEEYLLSLPLGEHNWVEMKGRRTVDLTVPDVIESKVRDDLSKAISALANSGGGVLVLGINELPNGWAVDDGGVAVSVKGRMKTREWLEDVIPNLVEERLVNFNVYEIAKAAENSQIEEGRGVFVIEVGDSEQAPHQANDNKYYARVGGKSRPIGHRLVMDIANRRRHPKVELEVEFHAIRRWEYSGLFSLVGGRREETVLEARFWAKNVGRVYANYMTCYVSFPSSLVTNDSFFDEAIEGKEYRRNVEVNTRRDYVGARDLRPEYGPSWFAPILPGLSHYWSWRLRDLSDLKDWSSDIQAEPDDLIYWEIYADNAPVEKGMIKLKDIDVEAEDNIDGLDEEE